ncbi:MAG: shikimate dehydrogenase [Rhodospirillales bacterium]|jgi:shikimate dehydrogenase|nr:shikimate dehydrogenase [Rhodospirillales bacterium]
MKIGLIGSGISRSSSPRLHAFLGGLYGVDVEFHSIDAEETPHFAFDGALDHCAAQGFRGVNVTHPFKENARARVRVDDPSVACIGAVNTVTFEAGGWRGANTDFTGFVAAFRHRFGAAKPGRVVVAGAGGVGKAIAFALDQLGAERIQLFDTLARRAADLASALTAVGIAASVVTARDFEGAVAAADGLVNGTPIGMYRYPGIPFPPAAIHGQRWAFDAVYTPLETEFLTCARAASLEVMSGYDLFLFQGFKAFSIFSGIAVDEAAALAKFPPPPVDLQNDIKKGNTR